MALKGSHKHDDEGSDNDDNDHILVSFGGNSVYYSTRVLVNYDDDQKQPLNLIKETIGFRFTLWTELAEAMNVNSAERFQSHYKSTKYVCWQNRDCVGHCR